MNYWPDHPNLEPIRLEDGEEGYLLEESWAYTWQVHARMRTIIIPRGFVSDGASVPRIAWTLVGLTPDGLIRAAALLHDFLYRHHGKLPQESLYEDHRDGSGWRDISQLALYSRKDADRMFCRVMREAGMDSTKRWLAFWAVRIFGWSIWRRNARS